MCGFEMYPVVERSAKSAGWLRIAYRERQASACRGVECHCNAICFNATTETANGRITVQETGEPRGGLTPAALKQTEPANDGFAGSVLFNG